MRHPPQRLFKASKSSFNNSGFTLVELLVSVVLVGALLSMIAGAIVMLDKAVANERIVPLPVAYVADTSLESFGYSKTFANDGSILDPVRPNYTIAPSRLSSAQADALFRQVKAFYSQSYAVAVVPGYVQHDFTKIVGATTAPNFLGTGGWISPAAGGKYLTAGEIADPATFLSALQLRYPTQLVVWDPTSATWSGVVDADSYRAATVFFMGQQDRILAILRMRAWQFKDAPGVTCPYRFYEVNLSRLVWTDSDPSILENWMLYATGLNFLEDFSYRFVEDKLYPQHLIFPPTISIANDIEGGNTSTSTARNVFIRKALKGEDNTLSTDWTNNTNPGASRLQVALSESGNMKALVDEWHMILPDPGIPEAEDRARMRRQSNFSATLYQAIRRQGRFFCALQIYP